jgi:hypothetical protein
MTKQELTNMVAEILSQMHGETEPMVKASDYKTVIYNEKKDQYYIIYHRHPLGSKDGNNRVTCIDLLQFDKDGNILPVKMTFEGVKKAKL